MPLIEKRYAQALLELSAGDIYNVKQEFSKLVETYNDNTDLRGFLLDPRIKPDNKQALLKNVFSGELSKNMLNFLLLLISKQRIRHIPQIFEQFVHLTGQMANVLDIKIITVEPLNEAQLNGIKEKFKKIYSANGVNATEIIDESLIGGIKVVIGDKVYDGSIKGRIESLTELVAQ